MPSEHGTWADATLAQHWTGIGIASRVCASLCFHSPADTTRLPGAGLMLIIISDHIQGRANSGPAFGQRVVFAEPVIPIYCFLITVKSILYC